MTKIPKFKAAIFDMDGLLIDSMLHWIDADHSLFKELNIHLTEEIIKRLTGRSEQENMSWLKKHFNLDGSLEELLEKRKQFTDTIYTHKSCVMPGVHELIAKTKGNNMKLSVSSGAPLRQIELVMDKFNWHDHFDALISSDHVNFIGKPDPAIYLHTAKVLKVEPAHCVVFEDAENGVVSAKEAGMRCIAVLDKRWSFGDFSRADLVVESLEDKKILKFIGL